MKRFLILTVLLLSFAYSQAQTIDFTGVSINTEHIKKVYERKSFVLGTLGVERFKSPLSGGWTGSFGIRYGMVWKFGFYVGADIGMGGIPKKTQDVQWNTILSGMRRDPRLDIVAGGIWRVKNNFNLYLGSGFASFQTLVQQQDKEWREYSSGVSPIAELGAILHVSHLSLMLGAGYAPMMRGGVRATLGVGYNF